MPVPLATVIVNFIVSFSVTGDYTLEFTFENESLRHLPGRTIRIAQMESWIDRIYEDKLKVR